MNTNSPYVHTFTAMTVPCEVQLFSPDAAHIARRIEANTRRLEQMFNFYDPASMLSRQLNQRQDSWVALDEETLAILSAVRAHSSACNGIFDITIGTVKHWQQQSPSLAKQAIYQQVSSYMGLDAWQLEAGGIRFHHSHTRVDLGGVIKEVAVDQAVEIALAAHVDGILVNFGGDLRVAGGKPDGSDFVVAVRNPRDPSQPLFALPLRDQALTTSAHYARQHQFSDQQTSHILAAQGTHHQVLSATVVAPTALQAGIFSTALTIDPTLTVAEPVGFALVDHQLNVHQDTRFLTS
ncbi:FAD:protein FMN transferase [Photobacterium sp. MCCC 1A19761]|uniref:FAD:protein FMN transferase n=1 Tax=Photobacterium sp. MCCC 1A19761 TaxID=3115000 RepID=UPI00307E90C7